MSPLDFTILERLAVCRQGWFRTTHAVKFVMHHLMRHFKDPKVMGFRTGARSLENVARLHDKMLRGMMETPYDIDWHHCGSVEQWEEGPGELHSGSRGERNVPTGAEERCRAG